MARLPVNERERLARCVLRAIDGWARDETNMEPAREVEYGRNETVLRLTLPGEGEDRPWRFEVRIGDETKEEDNGRT